MEEGGASAGAVSEFFVDLVPRATPASSPVAIGIAPPRSSTLFLRALTFGGPEAAVETLGNGMGIGDGAAGILDMSVSSALGVTLGPRPPADRATRGRFLKRRNHPKPHGNTFQPTRDAAACAMLLCMTDVNSWPMRLRPMLEHGSGISLERRELTHLPPRLSYLGLSLGWYLIVRARISANSALRRSGCPLFDCPELRRDNTSSLSRSPTSRWTLVHHRSVFAPLWARPGRGFEPTRGACGWSFMIAPVLHPFPERWLSLLLEPCLCKRLVALGTHADSRAQRGSLAATIRSFGGKPWPG